MAEYKVLDKQKFSIEPFSIVPLRRQDRYKIMGWRNDQIYHLRQTAPLTRQDQDKYFEKIVESLYDNPKPEQLLFSLLKQNDCIGYGGLVHINWVERIAELSFLMDTSLEKLHFRSMWEIFLTLIEEVAFTELKLKEVQSYILEPRDSLINLLEENGYVLKSRFKSFGLDALKCETVAIHIKGQNL